MNDNVNIRLITLEDVDQLQTIGRQTFLETFQEDNSEDDMKSYLEESFSTKALRTELTDHQSKTMFYYFAEIVKGSKGKPEVIGYLKLNLGSSQTEMKSHNALEIERIYVLKAYHGKKVGQLLYQKALEVAQNIENKVDYIWLGVWEHNPRAIRFYEKNGFEAFDKHIFKLGDDEQTDIMMKLVLQ